MLFAAQAVAAQSIRLDARGLALGDALQLLGEQAGVDVVFAERLVQGRRSTCLYEGDRVEEALDCLLRSSDLSVERVRRTQYVVVPLRPVAERHRAAPVPGVISGYISDAATGERLIGANVLLVDLRLGTTTNAAGYFAIPALPQGDYAVRVSYVGYETRVLQLAAGAENGALTIALTPAPLKSEEVVVEAAEVGSPETSTLPGAHAFTPQDLETLPSATGEQDLFQSLQWVAGVQKPGELNAALIVRGGEADQNLYLLDGVPVYHPWHAFSLISTFQAETFKEVRLYRGTFPAEHGGRLSSVLDTQLKDGSRTGTHASAALSILSGRMMVESPLGKNASFMVAGRRSYIDRLIGRKHPVQGSDGRRDTLRTGYHFYDLSGKLTYQLGARHRLSVSHYRGRDVLDLRLPFDLSLDFDSWLRPADLFFEVDQQWGNVVTSLRHQYLPSRRLFATTTLYQSAYDAKEAAYILPSVSSSIASDYRVSLKDMGVRIDVDYYLALTHQVRTGLQVVRHRFQSDLDAAVRVGVGPVEVQQQRGDVHAWDVALYVQDSWQPSHRWQVVPGIRASFFGSGSYWRIDPGLNVRYNADPKLLVLRAGIGTQVQYMHRLRDRYSYMYDLVSSRWVPASAAVRPSHSLGVALSGESRPLPSLSLMVETYWRESGDVLLPEDVYRTKDGLDGPGIDVGTLLGEYTSARSRAYGAEFSGKYDQGPLHLWLNYALSRSVNATEASPEQGYYVSRFDLPVTLQGAVRYERQHWDLSLTGDFRSGYPHSVPEARYRIGDPLDPPEAYLYRPAINNGRLPPYVRADLGAAWKFRMFTARWRVQAYFYNVLGYRSTISRQYDPTGDEVQVLDRRSLPLIPLLEVEVRI